MFTDGDLLTKAASASLGLGYIMEDQGEEALASGELERMLEDWCTPFPGYHLYYPDRRHPTAAFKVFVDALVARRDRQ